MRPYLLILVLLAPLVACIPRGQSPQAPRPAAAATEWIAKRYVGPQQCDPDPKPDPRPDEILARARISVHRILTDIPTVVCDGCGCPSIDGTYYVAIDAADVERALELGFQRKEPPARLLAPQPSGA